MTREDEIKLVASCHIAASNEDFKEYYEGFIAGAKWADKTMIDKACDWIKKSLYYTQYKEHCFDTSSFIEFIEEFKKAMDEQL